MSGTSLDGLDIAFCTFSHDKGKWAYSIVNAETNKYNPDWSLKLKNAHQLTGEKLVHLHSEYGELLGKKVSVFIKKYKIKSVDFVSSHGHTIFHNPQKGYTFQIGNGASIAAESGLKVVCDFRTIDVALKGQGAPLVPIGDRLLFSEFNFCLNLGGFSNISFESGKKRIAFDICPVNTVLNYLSSAKGKSYDKGGAMARSGQVSATLLKKLNGLAYYKTNKPKSLGREWLESYFLPIINSSSISIEDKLATVTEHVAIQVARVIEGSTNRGKVLVTGGGAHNSYLISKLKEKLPSHNIIVPSYDLVNYKEALVFAFLGVLKIENRINTLCSVTGATIDSRGGVVYAP